MKTGKGRIFFIKVTYWLGIVADALWSVALLFPAGFAILTGKSDFDPDIQVRLIMGMGGSLMIGWTILLIWAVRRPIERRFVILLTYPVVLGMFIVSLVGYLEGCTSSPWILIKTIILMIAMTTSYILSCRVSVQESQPDKNPTSIAGVVPHDGMGQSS